MPFNMERLQVKGDHDGKIIYVDRYDYQGILRNQTIDIISIRAADGKVVIDYVTKRNRVRGCRELKDHGPVKA